MNSENGTSRRRPLALRFSSREKIIFGKRLSMMLRSGFSIIDSVNLLAEESKTASAGFLYRSFADDLTHGKTLASALAKFDRVFDDFCINIVRVGENSGTLSENLNYYADELKRKRALKRTVVGSLTYPALIVAATLGITVLLTLYIFPKIIPIFQGVRAQLPLPTRSLIAMSAFLQHFGALLGIGLLAGAVVFAVLLRVPAVRLRFDAATLRVPVVGTLLTYYNLSNITRTLAILLKSDMPLPEALELAAAGARNSAYRRQLEYLRLRIIEGQKIAPQLKKAPRLFPSVCVQMVSAGESTGTLPETLQYLSVMYEDDIQELTKQFTTLLEPILMIAMGLVVGFIAVSIIMPIYSITENIHAR